MWDLTLREQGAATVYMGRALLITADGRLRQEYCFNLLS
jgi:hypothetical protein